jgi:hypothetical protein
MRKLLASAALCTFLAGCATESNPPAPVYKDQRTVTTRPAAANGKNPDLLLRVCELQVAPGQMIAGDSAVPADARLVQSVETLLTFGTPLYCTVGQADQRVELGAVARRESGTAGTCVVQIDYAHRSRSMMGGIAFNSAVMVPVGQTRVLMGGNSGVIVTMVLEPLGKSPTTRP